MLGLITKNEFQSPYPVEARDYVLKNERLLTPLNTIMYVVQSSSPYDYSCLFNPANSITHTQTIMHKYLRPIRSFGAAYGSLRSLRSAFTMNTSHKKRTQNPDYGVLLRNKRFPQQYEWRAPYVRLHNSAPKFPH